MPDDATTGVESVPVLGQTVPPELSADDDLSDDLADLADVSGLPVDDTDDDPLEATLLPIQRLDDKVRQTDAALGRWRSESVKRREEWEEQNALEEVERQLRRGRLRIALGVAAVVAAGMLAAGLTVWNAVRAVTAAPVVAAAAPAEPATAEAADPVTVAPRATPAEGIDEPVAAELADAPTADEMATASDVAAGSDEGTATGSQAVPVDASSVRFWTERGLAWTEFVVTSEEPVHLQWLDAAGEVALEPMSCGMLRGDGTRLCTAGRTHGRIRGALKKGAEPGAWTVQVCGTPGCTTAGTFEVAAL